MHCPTSIDSHNLVWNLPIFRPPFKARSLPPNAIYFMFEEGESAQVIDRVAPRIVRVGTHRVDGRFPQRIQSHFGKIDQLGGNKNSSVFRKHLGGAIARRNDPTNPIIPEWDQQGGQSDRDLEISVSQYLYTHISFTYIGVPSENDRIRLESGLIATLAQDPIALPSPTWLGRFAANPMISESGLWNTQHIRSNRLSANDFELLCWLAQNSDRS